MRKLIRREAFKEKELIWIDEYRYDEQGRLVAKITQLPNGDIFELLEVNYHCVGWITKVIVKDAEGNVRQVYEYEVGSPHHSVREDWRTIHYKAFQENFCLIVHREGKFVRETKPFPRPLGSPGSYYVNRALRDEWWENHGKYLRQYNEQGYLVSEKNYWWRYIDGYFTVDDPVPPAYPEPIEGWEYDYDRQGNLVSQVTIYYGPEPGGKRYPNYPNVKGGSIVSRAQLVYDSERNLVKETIDSDPLFEEGEGRWFRHTRIWEFRLTYEV